MRFILTILLIAVLSFIAGIYFPWWSIAIISFLVALLFNQSLGRSFLAGFLGIFLLWTLIAVWIDLKNQSILSIKVAELFPLAGSNILLILVTALVGSMVSGFAALSGSSLGTLIKTSIK